MSKDLTERLNNSDDDKLNQLITMVQGLTGEVKALATQVQAIDGRLTDLETKVDERLRETRPIWEAVQNQLTELKTTTEKGFRNLEHHMIVFSRDLQQAKADQVDLEERIGRLETGPA